MLKRASQVLNGESIISKRVLNVVKSQQATRLYEFGPFRIDTSNRLLFRDGKPIVLKPKVVDTLLLLLENSGRVMEKDELIKRLWPDSFVEEGNLTQNIYVLRKALDTGEDAESYIETIPRRGYRFAAPVKELPYEEGITARSGVVEVQDARQRDEELAQAPAHANSEEGRPRSAAPTGTWSRPSIVIGLIIVAGALIAASYYLLRNKPPVGTEVKSLAILPFKSLRGEAADEYMGQGMADALITKLSNSRRISVRPTSAVLRYSGVDKDPLTAGRELGVEAVLDGNVQHADDRVRVTVQLLRVADGASLWAEKFDAKFTDIFAVQDSISDQAARSLTLRLSGNERELMRKHYTENAEAYQAYLQGRYFWNKRNAAGFKTAVDYFQRAIKIDPNYALAYAGLADCYIRLNEYGVPMAQESVPRGKAAVLKALEIDDALAEAHTTLAFIKFRHDWDFAGAEQEFRRALELDDNYSEAHQWYAFYLLATGRADQGAAEMKRAQELDPLSISSNSNLALYFFFTRQFDQSVQQCRKTLEMEPRSSLTLVTLGLNYEQQGLTDDAISEFKKAEDLAPEDPATLASLGHALGKSGHVNDARRFLRAFEESTKDGYVPPYTIAVIHAGLGEKAQTLEWLERAFQDRSLRPVWLKFDPRLDELRQSGKLNTLIRRVGLNP